MEGEEAQREIVVGKQETEADDEGYTLVGGAGRCVACVKEKVQCEVHLGAIEAWRKAFRAGKVFRVNPAKTGCTYCTTIRHQRCELPATREMREGLIPVPRGGKGRGGSNAPSVASSSKRKLRQTEVELPPPTKRQRRMPAPMTQTDFWASVLRQMDVYERKHDEAMAMAARRELEVQHTLDHIGMNLALQNRVLHRIEGVLRSGDRKGKAKAGPTFEEDLAAAKRQFVFKEWTGPGEESEEDGDAEDIPIIDLSGDGSEVAEESSKGTGESLKGAEAEEKDEDEDEEAEETA
jgi:hypothetical protein